jgi:hypothetical protein
MGDVDGDFADISLGLWKKAKPHLAVAASIFALIRAKASSAGTGSPPGERTDVAASPAALRG